MIMDLTIYDKLDNPHELWLMRKLPATAKLAHTFEKHGQKS